MRLLTSRILTEIVDAETGQRGYLVSGDHVFLEPFDRANEEWSVQLGALRELTRDNPVQEERVQTLERLVRERLDLLTQNLRAHDAGARGNELAPHMMQGKATMDALRKEVDLIDEEEVRISDMRERQQRMHARWTYVLLGSSAIAFLLVAVLMWAQRRAAEAERRLSEERADLLRFSEEFIGMLGHDLRNPLNAIIMSGHLLRSKVPENERKTADRILRSGHRMERMIAQILDLARARIAGGIPLERKHVNLFQIVSNVVDELRTANAARPIEWAGKRDVVGSFDGDRLAQVVSNLVGNALEHGDPERPVTVRLDADGKSVELSVHSFGPPIPTDLLPNIFDPYRRGAGAPKSNGLGLGLYISHQIVRAHGGEIAVRSSQEDGTTFTVFLPRAERRRVRSARNLGLSW